jgi:UDP-N-acetylglucosamine:LPS N-acetylglucosamine transferase
MKLPSILLPYPFDRKQHQLANAQVFVRAHAAELVQDAGDPEENAKRLRPILKELMHSAEKRRRLARCVSAFGRFDSAEVIARDLLEMAGLVEEE